MNISHTHLLKIDGCINEIEQEYQKYKGLILTEDDLKCILYQKLLKLPYYSKIKKTADPDIYSTYVHCEVSWYGIDNKLSLKPDLTIMDPSNLSILRGLGNRRKLPSKQFQFIGDAIIFELKFIRQKSGITKNKFDKEVIKDWHKIQRLHEKLAQSKSTERVYCYFVIFNKTNNTCSEFKDFLTQNKNVVNNRILYKTGDVKFK